MSETDAERFARNEQDLVAQGTPLTPSEDPEERSSITDALRLAVHGASFGLSPKVARLFGGEEGEKQQLKDIEAARANLGGWGDVAEFAGGMLVPIPGLGVAKTAGQGGMALGKALLTAGAKGAGVGAATAAGKTFGETPLEEVNAGDVGEAAIEGAKFGAAGGALLHGVGELGARYAPAIRAAAAGADAGTIRKLAKKDPSYQGGLNRLEGSLERLEQDAQPMLNTTVPPIKGGTVVGNHPLQSAANVAERADKVLSVVGKQLEGMYAKMDAKLAQHNAHLTTNGFSAAGVQSLDKVAGPATHMSQTKSAAVQAALDEVKNMFPPNGQMTASEVWQKIKNIDETIYGIRGDDAIMSMKKKYLKAYRNGIVEKVQQTADWVGTEFGANFRAAKQQYGDARIAQSFGTQGRTADMGKHYFGLGVRGILGGAAGYGLASTIEKIDPDIGGDPWLKVPLIMAGSMLGQRGRAANTELWATRVAGRYAPATAKTGGVVGGMVGAQSVDKGLTNDEMMRRFFEEESKRNRSYIPRSPLNRSE